MTHFPIRKVGTFPRRPPIGLPYKEGWHFTSGALPLAQSLRTVFLIGAHFLKVCDWLDFTPDMAADLKFFKNSLFS
jgi:hypothetical protein